MVKLFCGMTFLWNRNQSIQVWFLKQILFLFFMQQIYVYLILFVDIFSINFDHCYYFDFADLFLILFFTSLSSCKFFLIIISICILYYVIMYCIVLYCIVLYCIVLYCIVLYCMYIYIYYIYTYVCIWLCPVIWIV